VRDRLKVDLVESNKFVGKEVKRPTGTSFWWIATGEFDEAGFSVAVEFAIVLTIGLAAMNRREPSLTVGLPRSVWRADTAPDVLTDLRICEPVISLQKDTCPRDVLCLSFSGRNEPLKRVAVFLGKIDDVLFSSHSCRYELREHNLASRGLKLH